MSKSERLCVMCSKVKNTCCNHREIYITKGDVRRIVTFTGKIDFFEFRHVSNPAYLDQEDDPLWANYVTSSNLKRRLLKLSVNGDCIFLSSYGCLLPMDIRPLVCRLFPFEYNAEGFYPHMAAECPIDLLDGQRSLTESLDMDVYTASQWHRTLYVEILEEAIADENRSDI